MQSKVEDVTTGDEVLRYGMWFEVEKVEIVPAERGGDLHSLWLKPISRGGKCTLTLSPGELVTCNKHGKS
jgi:hypothetical protein